MATDERFFKRLTTDTTTAPATPPKYDVIDRETNKIMGTGLTKGAAKRLIYRLSANQPQA